MNEKRIILIRNAKSYDFGGGERFPVFVSDILQNSGYTPLIMSRSDKLRSFADAQHIPTIKGWWWSRQNWSGPYVVLFPVYFVWQFILTMWYLLTFMKYRPSVVHIQSKDDFIAATIAGRLLGVRIVWTDHADLKHVWQNLAVWYKNPIGKVIYLCAHLASSITVVSRSEYNLVTSHIPKESTIIDKMHVVYNGVLDTAHNYSKKTSDNDMFTFCVASRMVSDKGIKEVIEAYQSIHTKLSASQLLLLGDGPEMEYFKKLANDTPAIKFLGHQHNPLEIMSQADVFIHPTYHEGFSVALVEAGMLGMPIIATEVGGNVEIINNKQTGLLIPTHDSVRLAEAMNLLAHDERLRTQLGKAAREQYVSKFQFDNIVKQSFIPLYEGQK